MPPVGPENVWLSSDGTTWKLLPADTSLAPIEGLRPGLGTLWNRVVLASLGPSGTVMDVRLGDISG